MKLLKNSAHADDLIVPTVGALGGWAAQVVECAATDGAARKVVAAAAFEVEGMQVDAMGGWAAREVVGAAEYEVDGKQVDEVDAAAAYGIGMMAIENVDRETSIDVTEETMTCDVSAVDPDECVDSEASCDVDCAATDGVACNEDVAGGSADSYNCAIIARAGREMTGAMRDDSSFGAGDTTGGIVGSDGSEVIVSQVDGAAAHDVLCTATDEVTHEADEAPCGIVDADANAVNFANTCSMREAAADALKAAFSALIADASAALVLASKSACDTGTAGRFFLYRLPQAAKNIETHA